MPELSPYIARPSSAAAGTQNENSPPRLPGMWEEETHLWDYLRVLNKHRILIIAVFLTTLGVAAFRVYSEIPLFTAGTTVLVERQAPQVLNLQDATAVAPYWDEYDYYKTQYEILRSRTLAAQVIRERGLTDLGEGTLSESHPRGLAAFWEGVKGLLTTTVGSASAVPSFLPPPRETNTPDAIRSSVNAYLAMLEVQPVRHTRLVQIVFRTPLPDLSAQLANLHADAYIRQGLQLRTQASSEAEKFLEEKLVELKERLEKSEGALNQYRRDKGIISLDDKENIVVDRLSDLNNRLTEAEAERIGLEAQVQLLRTRSYDSLPAVLNSTPIQALREQLARLERERAQLGIQFKEKYPGLAQLEAQLTETRQWLRQEIQTVTSGLESAYLTALARERELRKKMEEQKAATLGLKDASVTYAILAREVDTNRQLYDNVLQRMKEIRVMSELRTSNVSIIDKAEPPTSPSSPNKKRSLMLGAIFGLLGGVGLAFFFEYLDNTLKTPEEAERYLQLPSLSIVPDFTQTSWGLRSYSPRKFLHSIPRIEISTEESESVSPAQPEIKGEQVSTSGQPPSIISEAYRILRAAMLLSRPGEPPRKILFTSATQGEGKTTTVGNVAIAFAQMGAKVLVIDSDLRRSRFHAIFDVENQPGLTELLTGQKSVDDVILTTTVGNLFVMSCGTNPPNPAELVGSQKMADTLSELGTHYDYIFLDAPPVIPVSDAVLLSAMVDGVVLVVGGQKTPKRLVRNARKRLGAAQAKILGIVLNRVNLLSGDYSEYYHYYRSYYHQSGTKNDAATRGYKNASM
jgi:capsular exopolysaccharide synthesis family protein